MSAKFASNITENSNANFNPSQIDQLVDSGAGSMKMENLKPLPQ